MNRTEVEEPFEGLLDQVTLRLSVEIDSNIGRVCESSPVCAPC